MAGAPLPQAAEPAAFSGGLFPPWSLALPGARPGPRPGRELGSAGWAHEPAELLGPSWDAIRGAEHSACHGGPGPGLRFFVHLHLQRALPSSSLGARSLQLLHVACGGSGPRPWAEVAQADGRGSRLPRQHPGCPTHPRVLAPCCRGMGVASKPHPKGTVLALQASSRGGGLPGGLYHSLGPVSPPHPILKPPHSSF